MSYRLLSALSLSAVLLPGLVRAQEAKVSFTSQVLPILEKSCFRCHQEASKDRRGRLRKPKGGLRLDGAGWIQVGGKKGLVVQPGKPEKSPLYVFTTLAEDDDDIMPAKGKPLTKSQTEILRRWIAQGADFGGWTGKGGPGAEAIAAAKEAARPRKLNTGYMQLVQKLGAGVQPALPQAVARAAGKICHVKPVQPGSSLLRVDFVSNESSVEDGQLDKLVPLAGHITALGLSKTRIGDASMAVVGRMSRLTRLDLSRTHVSDQGLPALRGLDNLVYLNLHSTDVTDRGLDVLAELRGLQALYLWNTKVTPAGVARLQKDLPKTKIHFKLALPDRDERPDAGGRPRRRR